MIVYLTKNLITGKMYVGKDSHNNAEYLGSGSLLLEDIKKYGKENFQKIILEECTKDNLGEREEFWINTLNACGSKDYYNIRSGTSGWYNKDLNPQKYQYVVNKISEGNRGKIISESHKESLRNNQERKEKLSKANKGKPKPEGFGQIISQLKTGKKLSKDHCVKISQGKLGKKQPQSFLEKKYKHILQLSKEGEIIKEFKSIEEAANSNLKWKRSNISCCLTGKSKTAYGFIFKYS